MSQITTHILDTSIGMPAINVSVFLEQSDNNGGWVLLGSGQTNSDGRVVNLLAENVLLQPGIYRLIFDTGNYFSEHNMKSFYPEHVFSFSSRYVMTFG